MSLIQFSQINLNEVQAYEHPNPDGIAAPVQPHDQYIPNGPIQLAMVTNNNFNGDRPFLPFPGMAGNYSPGTYEPMEQYF